MSLRTRAALREMRARQHRAGRASASLGRCHVGAANGGAPARSLLGAQASTARPAPAGVPGSGGAAANWSTG